MKVIIWDIETAPILATTWGLWNVNLSHKNIIEDTSMISAAWKVLGSPTVYSAAIKPTAPRDDKALVKALRDALSTADVLVAHNGDKFDLKVLNARLIHHGLEPLPPVKTVDTLKVAKKHFRFTSNRLDYLGEFLGVGRKIHTDYDLWLRILLKHDKKALATMLRYNKQDVTLLEKVYLRLRPFMTAHPNHRLCDGNVCPTCGAKASLQKRGFRLTRMTRQQAYQCQKCGGWSTGPTIDRTEIS